MSLLPARSAAHANIRANCCPLCSSEAVLDFAVDRKRSFLRCDVCRLVFVPPFFFLAPGDERRRYDLHRNRPDNDGYRSFLRRLLPPLVRALPLGARGLDFGSGPEPLLVRMLEEAGYRMSLFDPFYAPDTSALAAAYDFITATEVLEHLRDPGKELERLWSRVRPGGVLAVMTRLYGDREAFCSWYYKNDLTHVCFFSPATLTWLAEHWHATLEVAASDIALFHKSVV